MGQVIEAAADSGCWFDSWRDFFDFSRWEQAIHGAGLSLEFYLRRRDEHEVLPWDHLSCAIPKEFFRRERAKALNLEYTPDCRSGVCSNCGACDFKEIKMRYADPCPQLENPAPKDAAKNREQRFKVRLQMAKTGKARFVSHLEFMTVVDRALRRIKAPVRFSEGFHPHPRISFPDALPIGVETRAEIIDVELYRAPEVNAFSTRLNAELPDSFQVLQAREIAWNSPTPAASIYTSTYHIPRNQAFDAALVTRIKEALDSDTLLYMRTKKDKKVQVDLRPDIADLSLDAKGLTLTLFKGSPVVVAAYLLNVSADMVRTMGICKTHVTLKQDSK